MRAFRRIAARIAPPDLAEARNLIGEDLVRIRLVQPIEEVIDVHVVLNFANNTIVHHEAAIADPEVDAIIFDDTAGRDDRRGGADRVESEHIRAARIIAADQAIERPEETGRVLPTATKRQPLDDLRTADERIARVASREVRGVVRVRPFYVAVLAEHKQVRVQHNDATADAASWDRRQGSGVVDVADVRRVVSACRNIERRIRGVRDNHCRATSAVEHGVELPQEVRASCVRRRRARHDGAGVTSAINRHALQPLTVTHVGIDEVVQ